MALAAALATLSGLGRECVAAHEAALLRYATDRLRRVPGIHLYGPGDRAGLAARLCVVPFNLEGLDHGLVAAVLGYEHGIGVRSGCFCAHPYMAHLLGLDQRESEAWARRVARGDMGDAPGMVRISVGCYNDEADVDRVAEALERVAAGDIAGIYDCDGDGEHQPHGYREPMLFSLAGAGHPMSRALAVSVGSRAYRRRRELRPRNVRGARWLRRRSSERRRTPLPVSAS